MPEALLPDSGKIDALVATAQALLDRFNAQGRILGTATINTAALSAPIVVSIDIPLPMHTNKMELAAVDDGFVAMFKQAAAECQEQSSFHQKKLLTEACATDQVSHPVLWQALHRHVVREYLRANHQALLSAIDWSAVLVWLKANWSQVITVICSIILVLLAL